MAGNNTRISTDEVNEIASQLEKLNKELSEKLTESKSTIEGLATIWEGEASQETISSFNEFSSKYFQQYEDVIQNYVKFLRTNIAQGYFDVESKNVTLAGQFK